MQLRDRNKRQRISEPAPPLMKLSRQMYNLDSIEAPRSVQHLNPLQGKPRGLPPSAVPFPMSLPRRSRALQKLRASDVWKNGTIEDRLQQMGEWFPDMQPVDRVDQFKDVPMQDFDSPAAPTRIRAQEENCPTSDIGRLSKLPGELRNRIYRLAMLQPPESKDEPAKFAMKSGTCSQGTCLHSKLSYNVPGIANTCRQLRWEALPIFCVENKAFQFDDNMVHQCCVGNLLRSLGGYADHIREFQFILKRPTWNNDSFLSYATYKFTLTPPKTVEVEDPLLLLPVNKQWTLVQHEDEDRQVCQCRLDELITGMNVLAGKKSVGEQVVDFADSEELADFVWRMRKSKQWPQFLKKCKECKEVVFNN